MYFPSYECAPRPTESDDMTTVEEFLQPLNGHEELDQIWVVSGNALQKTDPASVSKDIRERHDPTTSRFAPLPEYIRDWPEFDVEEVSSDPLISTCLSRPCQVAWVPWIPSFARVIYNERQLEALYLQTLITRVNIALDKAIPPEEDRIAIVIGPGAFENVSAEATALRLMPDWIVVQGTFDTNMDAHSVPSLEKLAKNSNILAVGDTKLVRRWSGEYTVPHTRACHSDFLCQIQDYCVNLYTRFGFILSNEELMVAQFDGAQDASPRGAGQRELRSNGAQQLASGLNSDESQRSTSLNPPDQRHSHDSFQMEDEYGDPFVPPSPATSSIQIPSKRPHPSTSPETSPVSAVPPASGRIRYNSRSLSGSDASINSISHQSRSDPPGEDAAAQGSSQDHSKYTSSVREVEVGSVRIRSFDVRGWRKGVKDGPYEALFIFIMMIRATKLRGEPIHIS
ncbi:hypothetical protein V8C35DRAFT_286667 [Trichoderma chlorosporum]